MASQPPTYPDFVELAARIGELRDWYTAFLNQQRARETGAIDGGPNGDGLYPITDPTGVTTLQPCPLRMAADAMSFNVGTLTGAGPHNISNQYNGREIGIGNGTNTTSIQCTLQRAAPVGTHLTIRQTGSGRVRFVTQSGAPALKNRQNHDRTAGLYAIVRLIVRANANGSSADWYLDGDTAAL